MLPHVICLVISSWLASPQFLTLVGIRRERAQPDVQCSGRMGCALSLLAPTWVLHASRVPEILLVQFKPWAARQGTLLSQYGITLRLRTSIQPYYTQAGIRRERAQPVTFTKDHLLWFIGDLMSGCALSFPVPTRMCRHHG